MPSIEESDLHQFAMVWLAATGVNQRTGKVKVYAGEEISVRWNNGQSQGVDPKGDRITLDAEVVTTEDIPIGSILWEGTEDEWNDSGSENMNPLFVVKTSKTTPDIRARDTRRTLGLQRWKAQLPEIVS